MLYRNCRCGFTVAELITVIAIIAILAAIVLPVTRFALRRHKEEELHARLQKITSAIDRYKELRSLGLVKDPQNLGQEGYPSSLQELTEPIELLDGKFLRLLRKRDLIDPMTGRAEWSTSSNGDTPDSVSSDELNVFDIHSTSTSLALDGRTRYNEW